MVSPDVVGVVVVVVVEAKDDWKDEGVDLIQFRSFVHRNQQLGLRYCLLTELHFPKRMAPDNRQVSH